MDEHNLQVVQLDLTQSDADKARDVGQFHLAIHWPHIKNPARNGTWESEGEAAKAAGFFLHAGIAARAHQRNKSERLCRYVTRAAVSTPRLSLTRQSGIRYTLETPYRDGTTHVIFEPLGFIPRGILSIASRSHLMASLAAQVPRPRVNFTRFK